MENRSDLSMVTFSTDTERWDAIVRRNPQAEGIFVLAVKTTKIYCRVGCSARLPNRQNVLFFHTCDEAEQAGFRACKRCKPNAVAPRQQQADAIAKICQLIEQSETPPKLAELAAIARLSHYHFHRAFKQIVGVTPKAYGNAHRANRVRVELQAETSITEAIYQAGFETSSSFYGQSTEILGMTPTAYKQGGKDVAIQFAVKSTWLGYILVAGSSAGICAISLGDSAADLAAQLQSQFPQAQLIEGDRDFDAWIEAVINAIDTPTAAVDLPLDIRGTAFQQRVWQELQSIPPGSTASYREIAEQIGNPKAVRAVARACASNQLAIVIPCHRVIGSDGSLRGFRSGINRKRALLEREANPIIEE